MIADSNKNYCQKNLLFNEYREYCNRNEQFES